MREIQRKRGSFRQWKERENGRQRERERHRREVGTEGEEEVARATLRWTAQSSRKGEREDKPGEGRQ